MHSPLNRDVGAEMVGNGLRPHPPYAPAFGSDSVNFSGFASSTKGIASGPIRATNIAQIVVGFTWRRLAMRRQITAESSQMKAGIYAVIVNSSYSSHGRKCMLT